MRKDLTGINDDFAENYLLLCGVFGGKNLIEKELSIGDLLDIQNKMEDSNVHIAVKTSVAQGKNTYADTMGSDGEVINCAASFFGSLDSQNAKNEKTETVHNKMIEFSKDLKTLFVKKMGNLNGLFGDQTFSIIQDNKKLEVA